MSTRSVLCGLGQDPGRFMDLSLSSPAHQPIHLTYLLPRCNGGNPGRTSCVWRTRLGPGPVLSPSHTLSHTSLHSGRQLLLSPHNSPVRWLGGPKPSLPCSLPHRVAGRTGLGPAGLSVAVALRRRAQGRVGGGALTAARAAFRSRLSS